jgi:hypothetical protein
MKEPIRQQPGKAAPDPKPSQLDEARRMIEQYAADLREMMAKLRKRFHRGQSSLRTVTSSLAGPVPIHVPSSSPILRAD